MDTDTLISKVFLRPAIWDKKTKSTQIEPLWIISWRDISGEMEVPGK